MWKSIAISECEFQFVRSQGAGGQHVNRTESAVLLRFNLNASRAFTPEEKERIKNKIRSRLTKEDDLLIRAEEHRERKLNRDEAIRKLVAILAEALIVPKKRKATKPTYSSQRKRMDQKKVHGQKKQSRSKVSFD